MSPLSPLAADQRPDRITRPTGSLPVGVHYDDRSGLLWVAGGGPGSPRIRTLGLGTVTA